MIRAARDYGKLSIPMIGINLGTLGYLAGTDRDGVRPTLDKLMADQYLLDDRMMLKGKVFKSGVFAGEELALNDIVIAQMCIRDRHSGQDTGQQDRHIWHDRRPDRGCGADRKADREG